MQVVGPERCAGFLVMRRSGVRFPKAAPAAPLENPPLPGISAGRLVVLIFDLQLKRLKCPRDVPDKPGSLPLGGRREIKKIAKSKPAEHDLPFSAWSLSKLAEFLVAEVPYL